jgi:hypothetical protein
MPNFDRDEQVQKALSSNFKGCNLFEKLQMIAVVSYTMITVFIPKIVMGKLTGNFNANVGRLKTIVKDQIYQQVYGDSCSTVLMSRKKDGLLIHTAPQITPNFLADIRSLNAPVKYIYISNEVHEMFAFDAKQAFPDALLITPKPSVELVKRCVQVDGSVEEHLETLEKDFGIVKTFKADDNIHSTADRSFVIQLYGDMGGDGRTTRTGAPPGQCLFVGQCGYGHFPKFHLRSYLAGFQGLAPSPGRYFRMFYWAFTKHDKRHAINPYWQHMIRSVDDLKVAVFQHGEAIVGDDTKEKLLKFYVY